jgi:hypothetical protein
MSEKSKGGKGMARTPRMFYWEEGVENWMPVDDLDYLLDLDAIKDGEQVIFTFQRHDMTDAEYEAYCKESCPDGVFRRMFLKCGEPPHRKQRRTSSKKR